MTADEKRYLELFPTEKQKEWGWPATANFILGGAGAGFQCFIFLASLSGNDTLLSSNSFFLNLLGPIIVAVGLMLLPLEAGRSSRSIYLLHRLNHSWISREIAFYLIFLLAAVGDYVLTSVLLRLISVAGAIGMIISQGFIVYDSKALTAWNRHAVPWFFLFSGFASGAGVALLLSPSLPIYLSTIFLIITILSIAGNAITWMLYLFFPGPGEKTFRSVTQPLRRPLSLLAILGIGHFLPFCSILFLLLGTPGSIDQSSDLVKIAALVIIGAVAVQKLVIVHMAGDKRSIGFSY